MNRVSIRIILFALFFLITRPVNAKNKIENAASLSDSGFKELVESLLPPMIDWRADELRKIKEQLSPADYAAVALYYANNHSSRLFTKETRIVSSSDSILYASMFYIAEHKAWKGEYVPYVIHQYAERLYECGYNDMAAFWANIGVMQCLESNFGGPIYGELRSLESVLEVDSLPHESIRTQLAMLEGFKNHYENDRTYENHALLTKHYIRSAELALISGLYNKADSIKEEALDFLWCRKDPEILSGKVSIVRETSPDMFQLKAIESELYLQRGDTVRAIEENEHLLWRYYDNAVLGNLKAEHFPYYFKSLEFLCNNNHISEDNYEHLIYASEYIRKYLAEISPTISPVLREMFYQDARNTIDAINSQLLKFLDREEAKSTLYNNLLLFKGLELTTSRSLNNKDTKCSFSKDEKSANNLLLLLVSLQYQTISNEAEILVASDFIDWIKIDYNQIADKLQDGSVAIEFYEDKNANYYAIICAHGWSDPVIIPIILNDNLQKETVSKLDYFTLEFSSKIWQPILNILPADCKKIYFSPDGLLYGMAIEYLPIIVGDKLETLNDVFEVYRVSSTKEVTMEKHAHISNEKNLLLVGDINYGSDIESGEKGIFNDFNEDSKMASLAASKVEIERLYSLFESHGWKICKLTGDMVTRDNLLNTDFDASIEHISTHGFFINDELISTPSKFTFLKRPINDFKDQSLLRTGFVISSADDFYRNGNDDGIITAADIAKTDKGNVDLAVISACQSGQGVISRDGIHGLQRGYKIARTNSIIVALWDVDDWVSEYLIRNFYTNYLNGSTKREALKEAQRAVKTYRGMMPDNIPRNLELPKYWAPFILIDGID